MDSLTQALLGATTFAVIKDKEIGKKSLVIGAIAGTIPDLDVFLSPFFNEIEFITVHRSVSHSIILAVALSLILGEVFHRVYKKQQSRSKWMLAFFLAIMTHSILDWFTTYGTKLLSPFNGHLFSTNSIHVFEPIYTSVLLIGTAILLFKTKSKTNRQRIIHWTLAISTAYLMWTFVSKGIANNNFLEELERQHIDYDKFIVSPTPMNSLLWHGIAKTDNGFYLATYSLLDQREEIKFYYLESDNDALEKIKTNRLVNYYLDYTQGFPLVERDLDGNIKIYAIKYGPINYFGAPQFAYPLSLNENDLVDEHIIIDHSGAARGPVKNWKKLFERVRGI